MARKPKKPSFFKILVGDFSQRLRIPPKFSQNFNGGSRNRCSLRGPSGKWWHVGLEKRKNGLYLYDGWQHFVKDHHLEAGDILIFRFNGESKFKVTIYDTTASEKDAEAAEIRRSGSPVQAREKDEIVDLETEEYNEICEKKRSYSGIHVTSGKRPENDHAQTPSNGSILFKSKKLWNKVLDMEEAKNQVLFSLPMIPTNVCYYMIPLISVMFAGHLGDLELAGATLANSWAFVTGFAFMVGLSGALETLCGQGFGAKLYRMLGIYLQASSIISFLFSIIISIVWVYTEPILIFIHQDSQIAKSAAIYMRFLIPGLFAYGFLNNILRFLQTQSVVMPLVYFSLIPVIMHIGISYALVHWTALGFKGAPVACSISIWIAMLMLATYVLRAKKFEHTWEGFSRESFHYVLTGLKLALPSAAMVCLEFWAFEILVLLAGLMPSAEQTTSLVAMCVNTDAIAYTLTYGLSAAASTRVSNELGAGNPYRAKHAMAVALKLSVLLALIIVLALAFGHNIWAGLFSNSRVIIKLFASMTPFLAISIMVDSVQGVLSGVARGCGFQHLAVYVNLGTYFLVGITVACVLGFKLKLYAKGLWIGLICGLFSQAVVLMLVTLRTKWTQLHLPHNADAVLA